MTEDEAREKWCPMMAASPFIDGEISTRCIASDCMLWMWVQHEDKRTEESRGYCGLRR